MNRKSALKNIAAIGAVGILGFPTESKASQVRKIQQSFQHSVCRWTYSRKSLEELCEAAKAMGISSVELLDPHEWSVVEKYGLTCAMANGSPLHIPKGFNDPGNHAKLWQDYEDLIPKAAAAGLPNIICFSGNRKDIDDTTGLENCAKGLEPMVKLAEKHGITICMELLNSKVDHADYQCDRTAWGVALCEKLGSERFKLLYDIYHMQIMEGDIIATIRKNAKYIGHYHTGGVPGRNEIDETQELNYKTIMDAITATGYTGFVGQEFIPKNTDVFASLKRAIEICS